ncbi:hypothetical protein BCR43DRAFT_142314 [Syncephalastrum racemosum]|uniref:RABX5 catalytic core helical domain-containing protein n=1 Tax=Syncephalastrum racemosum TaxID=13706 RepID=A0A1X2HMA2_SYNRA|nr:hypothetical protein BCR43DRAFT_142314 [Syncephalastrum racemosum]
MFDSFSLDPSSITADHPKYTILASHVQLPVRGEKIISVMLIQKPISRADIREWATSRQQQQEDVRQTIELGPNEPLAPRVKDFLKTFRRRPQRNLDRAGEIVNDFLTDMEHAMQQKQTTQTDIDERLDVMESYICQELYDLLFTNSSGDESMQDEALQSRIAALNLLDLNLEHLGVMVEHPAEAEAAEKAVKAAGKKLQQLNSILPAKEKLDTLVATHQLINRSKPSPKLRARRAWMHLSRQSRRSRRSAL